MIRGNGDVHILYYSHVAARIPVSKSVGERPDVEESRHPDNPVFARAEVALTSNPTTRHPNETST